MHIQSQIDLLTPLLLSLKETSSLQKKIALLNAFPTVKNYTDIHHLKTSNPQNEYLIKSVIAIGQAPIVFNPHNTRPDKFQSLLDSLLHHLSEVELLYSNIGGIIGYHVTVLQLILENNQPKQDPNTRYIYPEGIDIRLETAEMREAIKSGLENMQKMGEIYPVGGAGDRLGLVDILTSSPLPAARLPFHGRSLIEELIRDVQAREYLYFKLYGQQLTTPIAMMTSAEKNNHEHILQIHKENNWFGRPPKSFFFLYSTLGSRHYF